MIDPKYFLHDEVVELREQLNWMRPMLVASVVINVIMFLVVVA